jgi:hypothetical protein
MEELAAGVLGMAGTVVAATVSISFIIFSNLLFAHSKVTPC